MEELKLLTIREYRIMNRIKKIQESNKDMAIDSIMKTQYSLKVENNTDTTTVATNIINPLEKLENALTRIQEQKRKCIDSLHKIETDNRKLELEIIKLEIQIANNDDGTSENQDNDSFIKALEAKTEETWDDYNVNN